MKKVIICFLLFMFYLQHSYAQSVYDGGYFPLNGFNAGSINNYSIDDCFGYNQYPCKNLGFTDEAGVANGAIYVNNRLMSFPTRDLFEYVNGFTGGILCSDQYCSYLNSFTIAFSFNLTNSGGFNYYTDNQVGGVVLSSITQNSNGAFSGYKISFGNTFVTDRKPTMQVNNFILSTPNAVDTGVWYHVAFVFDQEGENSIYKIFLNNQMVAYASSGLNPIIQPFKPTFLFAQAYPNPNYVSSQPYHPLNNRPDMPYNAYRGALDELRTYNRALNTQEITDIYNARLNSPYPAITSFSPATAAPGTSISITGNNFSSASAVTINGQSATFTIDNGNLITAVMPGTGRATAVSSTAATAISGIMITNSSGNAQLTGIVGTPPPPSPPIKIMGSTTACGVSLNDSALYIMPSANNASYQWTSSTSNMILTSGQGNDSLYVKFKSTFLSGTLTCKRIIDTDTLIRTLFITKTVPAKPISIQGPKNVCAYVGVGSGTTATYYVKSVTGATSYVWTLPDSVRVPGNSNAQVATSDTFINVLFRSTMAPDTIKVRALNPCGTSVNTALAIAVTNPSFTSVITGPTDACPSMISSTLPSGNILTYRVRKTTNISSYGWSVPANATIVSRPGGAGTANDTIINVVFDSQFTGGAITVTGISNCFTTPARSLYVYKRIPQPRSISVSLQAGCPSRQYRYSVAPFTYAKTYEWSVPSNASIIGRSDTTFVNVSYSGAASGVADYVKVRGINNCSVGNWAQVRVALPACTGGRDGITTERNPSGMIEMSSPAILENPTSNAFILDWKTMNVDGTITVFDATGKRIDYIRANRQKIQSFGVLYQPGSYFVKVQMKDKCYTFKLVKN